VKPGPRVQIVLVLSVLLVLASVPLFWVAAKYPHVASVELSRRHADSLGRVVAAHVQAGSVGKPRSELAHLLSSEARTEGVLAIGVYVPNGSPRARRGEFAVVQAIEELLPDGSEFSVSVRGSMERARLVRTDDDLGSTVVAMRVPPGGVRAAALVRIMGLYAAVVVAALLLAAYFMLTRHRRAAFARNRRPISRASLICL
jgi:hypothetical protein